MENDKLNIDELQCGFQKRTGTNMCSWTITSVIDYYNRAGRPVFPCSMDLSKAFHVVSWIQLFKELEDREVSPAVLRTLLYIYTEDKHTRYNGTIVYLDFLKFTTV